MKLKNLFTECVFSGMVYKMSSGAMPNILPPTLGGLIFWETVQECNGWKLQRNENTDNYRILNPDNVKIAVGSEEKMESLLRRMA